MQPLRRQGKAKVNLFLTVLPVLYKMYHVVFEMYLRIIRRK